MSENRFIEWKGGACPVDPGEMVEIQFADGYVPGPKIAANLIWGKIRHCNNIVAYRVIERRIK